MQLVDAAEHSLSSSETNSTLSLPLLSDDDDGSLSSGSKYFSVLFQDATARVRKAGVVFEELLLSLFLTQFDEELVAEGRFTEVFGLFFFVLSDAILSSRDSLVLLGALFVLELDGHSVTSCAGFDLTVVLSASPRSLAIEAYRLVLGVILVASLEAAAVE